MTDVDNTELHYIEYDAEDLLVEMKMAYMDAGGELLKAGDEKDMLLHAVHAMLMQGFASVDNALRMATLRYAQRDYLKIIGENRNCPYIDAKKATATVEITFMATGRTDTLEAGEAITADGEIMYLLDEDVNDTGAAQTVTVGVTCATAGSAGNSLLNGTQMQTVITHDGVYSIYCAGDATGGMDDEDYEDYRDRIREHGLTSITTGPATQYESVAKAVTSIILDANAIQTDAGEVGVYLLLSDDTGSAAIIQAVTDTLNGEDTRPLTDHVTVSLATPVTYTLNVEYQADPGSNVGEIIDDVVAEYQAWQDHIIGQAFNPDRLMALLYQAGCTRVVWGSGSAFDGGTVEYTTIQPYEHCKGTISTAVMQNV